MDVNKLAIIRCTLAALAATAIAGPQLAAEPTAAPSAGPPSTIVLTHHDSAPAAANPTSRSELVVRPVGVNANPAPQASRAARQAQPSSVAFNQHSSKATPSARAASASTEAQPLQAALPAQQLQEPHAQSSADLQLIQAHRLSLSASTEADYSNILRQCAEAMRQEPQAESRKFAVELSAWALNRRGQLRNDQGRSDLAMADFNAAIQLDATYWRALHNRGVSRAQAGQFAEAFDDVSRVIQLNPKFAKAFSNRATLYVQAGDMERALTDYEEALQLDGALVPALVGHGRICHVAGRREDALESFNEALKLAPYDAEVFCSRGDLLADLGRYAEALADYSSAIELNPQFAHAYRNGAWLMATCPLGEVRNADGALAGAQKALDCDYGERHAALDTLAAAQANAGQFDDAVRTIGQAIDIAPPEATSAYLARKELYASGQPFRTQSVPEVQAASVEESWEDVSQTNQAESNEGLQRSGYTEVY